MEETSIGHQQYLIDCGADGGKIVPLIEGALLGGGGLGGKGGNDGVTQRVQPPGEGGQEGGIGDGVFGKYILKVYIQPPVALLPQRGSDIFNELSLDGIVVEGNMGQIIGEAAFLGKGG